MKPTRSELLGGGRKNDGGRTEQTPQPHNLICRDNIAGELDVRGAGGGGGGQAKGREAAERRNRENRREDGEETGG